MNTTRAVLLVGVLGLAVSAIIRYGVPLDREQVLAWVFLLVTVAGIASDGNLATVARGVRDWSLFAVLFIAYDYSRGAAEALGMPLQIHAPILIDRALFPGDVPTVEIQARLWPFHGRRWWEAAMAVVYVSHFVVPYAVTGVLWLRSRSLWRAWLTQFSAVTVVGLVGYLLLPTMPPWLASRQGYIGTVERVSARGWRQLNLDIAEQLIDKGQAAVNLVAAFPSLHAAYPALMTVFFWSSSGHLGRTVLMVYQVSMALTLVIGGEHYVIDVAGGWFVAAMVGATWTRLARQRRIDRWLAS